jgi:hypothetical protein
MKADDARSERLLCCPIDGKPLMPQERVREERVPSTVPDYLPREKQAPYRRVSVHEVVKCSRGHTFKRSGNALEGVRS